MLSAIMIFFSLKMSKKTGHANIQVSVKMLGFKMYSVLQMILHSAISMERN